jgi:hypothetical protein
MRALAFGVIPLIIFFIAPVKAANGPIDPVPGSLTLGEILEREQWNNGPRPALRPVRVIAGPEAGPTPFPAQDAPVVAAPATRHLRPASPAARSQLPLRR